MPGLDVQRRKPGPQAQRLVVEDGRIPEPPVVTRAVRPPREIPGDPVARKQRSQRSPDASPATHFCETERHGGTPTIAARQLFGGVRPKYIKTIGMAGIWT